MSFGNYSDLAGENEACRSNWNQAKITVDMHFVMNHQGRLSRRLMRCQHTYPELSVLVNESRGLEPIFWPRLAAEPVADESVPADVRRPLAGSLNYLFKSLDLIDDGI